MRISVRGSAEAKQPPEFGRQHGMASASGPDKQSVVSRVSGAANGLSRALDALRESGVVTRVVVRPISISSYRTNDGKRETLVHQAQVSWSADFASVEGLADFAAAHGAEDAVEFGHTEWLLGDETRVRIEADCLARAVGQARERATAIAAAAGAGEVRFVEVADPGLMGASAQPEMRMRAMAMDAGSVDVQPGDITVRVELHATFDA